ncbi:MAG: rod shape-determining protein MreC [Alphaproteobacteria bacterium]|nr:MAG: rod shape-determining protein MreC [Alphaproteobacteria bacterium]
MRKPRSRDGRLADTLLGFGARFSLFLFITLAVAMLVVGRLEPRFLEDSRAVLADLAAPFLDLVNRPVEAMDKVMTWGENLVFVYRENDRLRKENARLRSWQVAAETLAVENQQLRALLGLKDIKATPVTAARVIGQSGGRFFQSVLINAGRRDGVAKGNTVADRNGVVGRVITVGRHSARVLLLNDLNSRIPVKILPAGVNAILAGDNRPHPVITFLPEGVTLNAGDWVVTTGHGGTFPPDMAVGRVLAGDGRTPYRVRLVADFDRLDFVRILAYEQPAEDQGGAP